MRKICAQVAQGMGFSVGSADSISAADAALTRGLTDILLLDLSVPAGDIALLEKIRAAHPEVTVLTITEDTSVQCAIQAMRAGASDHLVKPFSTEELSAAMERIASRRAVEAKYRSVRESMHLGVGMGPMVGRSPAMEGLYDLLSKVALGDYPALIHGVSSYGRELIARSIHHHSRRCEQPFIVVDCGSFLSPHLESELFGYGKGAIPGRGEGPGVLRAAGEGTVFLDEIGSLSRKMQARLLRILEQRRDVPGGDVSIGDVPVAPIRARILTGTGQDLQAMVESGDFLRSLALATSTISVPIPPLAERKRDIPLATQHILDSVRRDRGRAYTFDDDALDLMMAYDWPGDIFELELAVELACGRASGTTVSAADLPAEVVRRGLPEDDAEYADTCSPAASHDSLTIWGKVRSLGELEKEAIFRAIYHMNGDKIRAAVLLGIGKTTLYRKLKEYAFPEDPSTA